MDQLDKISVQNTVSVKVNCQVDQMLISSNFSIIQQCLKDLKNENEKMRSDMKEYESLKEKMNQMQSSKEGSSNESSKEVIHEKVQKGQENRNSNNNSDFKSFNDNLEKLTKRVQKNEENIMGNTKDVNLLNKDVSDVKSEIEELKKRLAGKDGKDAEQKNTDQSYNINDLGENVSKQLKKNDEKIKNLESRLSEAEDSIKKLEEELRKKNNESATTNILKDESDKNTSDNKNLKDILQEINQLKSDVKDRFGISNGKIQSLLNSSNLHEKEITDIKEYINNLPENSQNNQTDEEKDKKKKQEKTKSNLFDGNDFNKIIRQMKEDIDKNKIGIEENSEQIAKLKSQNRTSKRNSQNSEKSRFIQKKPSERDNNDLWQKINELLERVSLLQKSKGSFLDEKNPEKLPMIKRPKMKDPSKTGYNQKNITKKDLNDLKSEIEIWIKSMLGNNGNQNIEELELRIQEIRKTLQKKADAEGLRKGLTFLQNKITQLYLFLTEPDTEDAMIVRKGLNCLSCSKKVEKLRGRIGPKINWNNMTSNNYSPPRVGYSKPEHAERQDDL